MNLTSDTDLAEQFGITVKKLHELRKRYGWPCVRLGRFDIRFTDAQVAEIVALQTEAPAKVQPGTSGSPIKGQSRLSASRRRSA